MFPGAVAGEGHRRGPGFSDMFVWDICGIVAYLPPAAFACSFLIEGYGTHDDARGRPLNHVRSMGGPSASYRCSLFSLRRH